MRLPIGTTIRRWRATITAAVLLFISGCDPQHRAATRPAGLHAEVSPIPGLSVAARIRVTAPEATAVIVRQRSEGRLSSETPPLPLSSEGNLSTTLVGLPADAKTLVDVLARYPDGRTETVRDLPVTTAPLPPDVPSRLEVAVHTGVSTGFLTLSMNRRGSDGGLAAIIDRSGHVLWYRRCSKGVLAFDKLPNGRLLVHQFGLQAFEEMDLDGSVVRRWTDPKSLAGSDGHDFRLLPNGHALIIGSETRDVDTREVFQKGARHAMRSDNTVNEVAPDGSVLWRWSTWSRVSEEELTDDPTDPLVPHDYEIAHANSLDPAPDGTFLVSLRNVSSVVKVDRRTGDIVWRLGGRRSDFRFEADPFGGFSRQHDARLVGPGRVLLFDNGNLHEPPESRAAEYELDEAKGVATLVWQYRHDPPLLARVAGSVQRLPNGNTLVSFGPQGTVTEVDARSQVVWELRTRDFGVYRARAIESVYP
jgi:hypothetical protein